MKRCVLLANLTLLAFALAQMAAAADLYVTTNGTGDGSSWASPTNSIQGAIDAIDGTYATNTVWVSNGVYEVGGVTNYPAGTALTNRVAIWKAITVRSANNDPTNTIIKGNWDPNVSQTYPVYGRGPAAVRCVYMASGSSLIGFTLTNGSTFDGSADLSVAGGGILCPFLANTFVSNCVITRGSAYMAGNSYACTLYNCTLSGGKGYDSGANARYGTMYNCTVAGGFCHGYGGGVRSVTLYSCKLTNNFSVTGGGASDSTLYNCELSGNSSYIAGGANLGTLYNCTIVNNTTQPGYDGGGTYGSTLYNCISWDNDKADYQPTAYYSCGVGYTNGGSVSGNITNNPLFQDSAGKNYRLAVGSPCMNTGTNFSWMTDLADPRSKDLDGASRIDKFNRRVDMGCYEYMSTGIMVVVR